MSKFFGMYSMLDEVAKNIKRGSGTGQAFINDLKKAGVKPVELKERGLDKIAELPKLTKPELIKRIESAPPPKLKETVLGEPDAKALRSKAEELMSDEAVEEVNDILGKRDRYNRDEWDEMHTDAYESKQRDIEDYIRQAKEMVDEGDFEGGTKYTSYTMPGGENHREILLKLPHFDKAKEKQLMELEANLRRMKPEDFPPGYVDSMQETATALRAEKEAAGSPYQSKHWDEPNVLAHMRVQDRKGPKGEKVLHVEEIQSDWHQQGKEGGYSKKYKPEELTPYSHEQAKAEFGPDKADLFWHIKTPDNVFQIPKSRFETMDEAQKYILDSKETAGAVPDAPFKENWHELAMKRLLNYAAENGYDKIAITPGAEQAKRYDLSKQVSRVTHMTHLDDPESGILFAFDPTGRQIVEKHNVPHANLPEYIGKEGAQKLLAQTPDEAGYRELSGQNLEIGGEGMKHFYDQRLPSFLNKYGQPHGVQVSPFEVEVGSDMGRGPNDEFLGRVPLNESVHGFDITPEMREELINRGLPLYKQGGQIKKRGQVHVSLNPDTMLLDLMSKS